MLFSMSPEIWLYEQANQVCFHTVRLLSFSLQKNPRILFFGGLVFSSYLAGFTALFHQTSSSTKDVVLLNGNKGPTVQHNFMYSMFCWCYLSSQHFSPTLRLYRYKPTFASLQYRYISALESADTRQAELLLIRAGNARYSRNK